MMDLKSKELKAFLNANKVSTRLIGPLERHILSRPQDTSRRTDVLHPSEIVKSDWCHRASYYVVTGKAAANKERPGLRLQSIFDEGHAIHKKWQGYLEEMGVLYGKWYCRGCGTSSWGLPDYDTDCGPSKYHEVPLEYPPLHIAGHSDGWVVGLGEDFLIEIKSIGTGTIRMEDPSLLSEGLESAWRNLRYPFTSHLRQGLIYLHLAALLDKDGLLERPAPKEIVFLYELKLDQSYKEFVVEYDTEPIQDVLMGIDAVVAAINSGTPPECNIGAKGCKSCLSLEGIIK